MKLLSITVSVFLLLCVPLASSQAVPSAGHGWDTKPATWTIAGGPSYLGAASEGQGHSFYGWNGSVSQYPYASRRWLGGTIEMSGHYTNESRSETSNGVTNRIASDSALYTYMGGPAVSASNGRVSPFAHVLFGAMYTRTTDRLNGHEIRPLRRVSSTRPGMYVGGGLDFGITSALALRAQADWVQKWTPGQAVNFIHASAGAVYRF